MASDELPLISPVIPLIIEASSDDSAAEYAAYADASDEHYVQKRAISQANIAPVSVVSVVKHEDVAVDDDSFEAAASSHIFKPVFRQRSIVDDRLRRREVNGAPVPAHGRKICY